MRLSEARAILLRITYKAGWSFRIDSDSGRFESMAGDIAWLHIENLEKDATRRVPGVIMIRGMTQIPLDHLRDEKDFIQLVRRAIRDRELHEVDEWLQLGGVAPFYPH